MVAIGVPAAYLLALLALLPCKGESDWDQMTSFHLLELWNSTLHGVDKQWNPLMFGGMSLAGDPQVPVFSLSMTLVRVLPAAVAVKLTVLVYLALGWLGAFTLARRFRLRRGLAALVAALFVGNGYVVAHVAHGHLDFLGTITLPLWLVLVRTAVRRPGEGTGAYVWRALLPLFGGGLLFALCCDGAPIAVLLLGVWVGFDALLVAWRHRALSPLIYLVGVVVIAVLLDAAWFFPLATNALECPRARPPSFCSPLYLLFYLLVPLRDHLPGAPASGHELCLFVGPVLAWLILRHRAAVRAALPPGELRGFAIAGGAMLLLGIGSLRACAAWLPPLPFDLLHALPGFVAIGIPARFWGYLGLPLAFAGAIALDRAASTRAVRGRGRLLWLALVALTLGNVAYSMVRPFVSRRGWPSLPACAVRALPTRIENVAGPVDNQALELAPNRGLLDAYNHHEHLTADVAPGSELVRSVVADDCPVPQVLASWRGWNSIVLELERAAGPVAIVLNQCHHPCWRSSAGAVDRSPSNNLRLSLPAGSATRQVELSFRDEAAVIGLQVSRWAGLTFGLLLILRLAAGSLRAGQRSRPPATGLACSGKVLPPMPLNHSGVSARAGLAGSANDTAATPAPSAGTTAATNEPVGDSQDGCSSSGVQSIVSSAKPTNTKTRPSGSVR
ncbi:MAG: hypothetical protein KDE27_08910 [Planctomycetes bacterium]|nr:hypothetical protein [Planctomycetota bacterium]